MTPSAFVILSSSSSLSPVTRDWQSAIVANGGTASFRDMQPFDRLFIRPSVADGLWNKIIDGAFFVGLTGLNSIMVKFKTAPGANRILVNNGFVGGDYTVSGASAGLLGNGSKNLQPGGLDTDYGTVSSIHLAAYTTVEATLGNRIPIGSFTGGSQTAFIRSRQTGNADSSDFSIGTTAGGNNGTRTGMTIGATNSSTTKGYSNGVEIHSRATSGALPGKQIRIFAAEVAGPVAQTNECLSFYSAGNGFTPAESLTISNRVNAVMAKFGASKF